MVEGDEVFRKVCGIEVRFTENGGVTERCPLWLENYNIMNWKLNENENLS